MLNNIEGAEKVNHLLMDMKLKSIPHVSTITTWGLPGCNVQNLGGHSHRSLYPHYLVFGAMNQIQTNLLEVLEILG